VGVARVVVGGVVVGVVVVVGGAAVTENSLFPKMLLMALLHRNCIV
jgi:hypothetical protein